MTQSSDIDEYNVLEGDEDAQSIQVNKSIQPRMLRQIVQHKSVNSFGIMDESNTFDDENMVSPQNHVSIDERIQVMTQSSFFKPKQFKKSINDRQIYANEQSSPHIITNQHIINLLVKEDHQINLQLMIQNKANNKDPLETPNFKISSKNSSKGSFQPTNGRQHSSSRRTSKQMSSMKITDEQATVGKMRVKLVEVGNSQEVISIVKSAIRDNDSPLNHWKSQEENRIYHAEPRSFQPCKNDSNKRSSITTVDNLRLNDRPHTYTGQFQSHQLILLQQNQREKTNRLSPLNVSQILERTPPLLSRDQYSPAKLIMHQSCRKSSRSPKSILKQSQKSVEIYQSKSDDSFKSSLQYGLKSKRVRFNFDKRKSQKSESKIQIGEKSKTPNIAKIKEKMQDQFQFK